MGTCDGTSLVVFLVGLAAGTFCTIASKLLFQMHAPGLDGRVHAFTPPLFQTFVMFLGMSFALPAHYLGEWYRARQAVHSECCGGASPAAPAAAAAAGANHGAESASSATGQFAGVTRQFTLA